LLNQKNNSIQIDMFLFNISFVVAKGKALKMDLVINSQKKQFLPMKLVHDHFELEHVVKGQREI
jgi:hypothetical protein